MKHHLNAEVQPCPCCAYRAEIEQVPHDSLDENSGGYYIECKRAGCGITTRLAFASMDDPLPGLVQSWNRRTARPEAVPKKLLAKIEKFRSLPENWDSYGGDPIGGKTVDAAKRVAAMLTDDWTVIPTSSGIIQFGYPADDLTIEVHAMEETDVDAVPFAVSPLAKHEEKKAPLPNTGTCRQCGYTILHPDIAKKGK